MNDAELIELVRERSGTLLLAPRDADGEPRALTEAERTPLIGFIALGNPYPPRPAQAIILEILALFETEEPKPDPEHMIAPPPPADEVPSMSTDAPVEGEVSATEE